MYNKQLDIRFLMVSNYHKWVINIVLVPKIDGRGRMSINFKDLKASPKDNFVSPHMDLLVDNTTRH